MQAFLVDVFHLPSFLFLCLWVIFPLWLAVRRRQGLIQFERLKRQGEPPGYGLYFELGVFIFAIPFTGFFILVAVHFILGLLDHDVSGRFKKSVEITALIMDIILILYMYLVERKIRLRRLRKTNDLDRSE